MYKQVKMGAVAGLAALALGGSAIANANQGAPHAKAASVVSTVSEPTVAGPDTDNVQSGDQTTLDSATAGKASELSTGESSSPSDGPGGHADAAGNQTGDQNAPDTGQASTSSLESSSPESSTSESSSASDGPGGHADPAGNVDNQQQG